MNFTAKSRYALKIMVDISAQENNGPQQRQFIAKRQSIPIDFMDQIISRLKSNKLIISIRGRNGGIKLAKPQEIISLWEIFSSVEDNLYPVKCLHDDTCSLENFCSSFDTWEEVFFDIKKVLERKSLKEMTNQWKKKVALSPFPPTNTTSEQRCNN